MTNAAVELTVVDRAIGAVTVAIASAVTGTTCVMANVVIQFAIAMGNVIAHVDVQGELFSLVHQYALVDLDRDNAIVVWANSSVAFVPTTDILDSLVWCEYDANVVRTILPREYLQFAHVYVSLDCLSLGSQNKSFRCQLYCSEPLQRLATRTRNHPRLLRARGTPSPCGPCASR